MAGVYTIPKACALLRAEKISFDGFVKLTKPEWERLATKLFNRWPVENVEIQDLLQIMFMEAWLRVTSYDPSRLASGKFAGEAVKIHHYVVFNACDKAKKYLQGLRSKKRGAQVTRVLSELYASDSVTTYIDICDIRFIPEQRLFDDELEERENAMEAYSYVMQFLPTEFVTPMAAFRLAMGDAARAAMLLFEDEWARDCLEISSLAKARRLVREAVNYAREVMEELTGDEPSEREQLQETA